MAFESSFISLTVFAVCPVESKVAVNFGTPVFIGLVDKPTFCKFLNITLVALKRHGHPGRYLLNGQDLLQWRVLLRDSFTG